ncbi:MAG: pyridoxamine 5'-phosphate oxidase family protein [Acidobacteriia bacterium]|nr:pyridoxamine 5'-phosphate oxidase family protein [Terriglobia bacterium]
MATESSHTFKKLKRSRPQMPKTYGMPADSQGMLSWEQVEQKIADAHNYWVGTTRPDGSPHAMPVWAVWWNGAVYFSTDRGSRKARNMMANATRSSPGSAGEAPKV